MTPTLTPFTVFVLALAAVEIARVVSRMSRDRLGIRSGLIWILAWAAVGIVAMFPGFLNWPLEISQMQNRFLFGLVLAVLFLLSLQLGLNSRLDRVDRAMRRAHQELAIARYRLHELQQLASAPTASDKPND